MRSCWLQQRLHITALARSDARPQAVCRPARLRLQLLLAASQQEVQTVIQLATTSPCCSLQFVAHIYDVLRASPGAERVISRPLSHFGGDQSEMYTLHYVETLAAHASTWQLAAEYLAWCPVHGSAVLEALLEKSRVSGQRVYSDLSSCQLYLAAACS